MGRTRRPCPACNEVVPSRPKDGICWKCDKLIGEAKRARKHLAEDKETMFVRLPEYPHWWPYYPNLGFGNDKHITSAWHALTHWLTEPAPANIHEGEDLVKGQKNNRDFYVMNVGLVPLLRALDKAIRFSIACAYREGKQRGGSLLTDLASGETTVAKYNEMSENQS